MKPLKPSDFDNYPHSCVLKNPKAETIAQNIMRILQSTGNEFRLLDWVEYNGNEQDRPLFDQVVVFCANEHVAKTFSRSWGTFYEVRIGDVVFDTTTTFQTALALVEEMAYTNLDFKIFEYDGEIKPKSVVNLVELVNLSPPEKQSLLDRFIAWLHR